MRNPGYRQIIVGCGFVGRQLAQRLSTTSDCIAITRTDSSAQQARGFGLTALSLDLEKPNWSNAPDFSNSFIYYLAPPPRYGNTDTRLSRFLTYCQSQRPRKIVYISTSGVYGNCDGNWVDENQPINPQSDRARRRADAESQLAGFSEACNVAVSCLRVGGIYGPTRIPVARASQTTVICPQEAPYTNRIHVHDLATACIAAMQSEETGCFNVSDGHPTTMTDYFYQIADRAGLARPPCVPLSEAHLHLSAGMLSFCSESRRLVIDKMLQTFQITLRYPTLREGLDSCADDFSRFKTQSTQC